MSLIFYLLNHNIAADYYIICTRLRTLCNLNYVQVNKQDLEKLIGTYRFTYIII